LRELDQPVSRRRFLRLLDGHDEKEERVIYPDIPAHVEAHADALLNTAIAWPIHATTPA
jgi:hemerythrin superfamily protein